MKKLLVIFAFVACMLAANNTYAKGIPIVWSSGQTSSITATLPDSIKSEDGKHLNLGVIYDQFSIFWVPLWNYGETKYVLLTDDEETYYDLEETDIPEIKEEFQLKVSDKPSVPFWQKVGGKPVIIAIAALMIWGAIPSKKDDEEEGANNQAPQ